jgi:hypothetical protein
MLSVLTKRHQPSVITLTESKLDSSISDDVVSIANFNVVRKDRSRHGGGVMAYIANNIKYTRLTDIESDDFEVLWLALRPKCLPRPLTILAVAVVYCSTSYDANAKVALANYLIKSVDQIRCRYPDCGMFIFGDFNTMNTNLFNKHAHLTQIIHEPTRGNNILDKVFTNCKQWYKAPVLMPPVDKSDHNCILLRPSLLTEKLSEEISTVTRRFTFQTYIDISSELKLVKWQDLYRLDDCNSQMEFFYCSLISAVEKHAPVEVIRFKSNDRPWVTSYFKRIISERDEAYRLNSIILYKKLRNKVNRIRKSLQAQFFLDRVDKLKNGNPSLWWKNIKSICRYNTNSSGSFDNLTFSGNLINPSELSNTINDFLASVTDEIPPLDDIKLANWRKSLGATVPEAFIVSEFTVFKILNKLKVNKAAGPDFIPNKLLKNFANELAAPICAIINSSIRHGMVPDSFKLARITPLPKCSPAQRLENDIRPIAVTNAVAKVAETVISRLFNQHFSPHLDDNQFGSTARRSTTH